MLRFGMVRGLRLYLAALMVGLGAAWGADAAVSGEGPAELSQLNTEIVEAKEELEAVRRRAYEADPSEVDAELARASNLQVTVTSHQ